MQSIINFIKYHNLFTIILGLVFLMTAGAFANEDVRKAVIGGEIVTVEGINNFALLSIDLDNFDMAMTIANVLEDEQNYYVDYNFRTFGIENNVWQPLTRQSQMTISKAALGGQDLGLYIAEEMGEVADYELNYLKEVQTAEREKGQTQIVETKEYTGLIGLVLDIKNKIFPGYKPMVQPPVVQPPADIAQISEPLVGSPANSTPTTPVIPPQDGASVDTSEQKEEPVCNSKHLDLCTTQELCKGIDLYWHNNQCNLEAEIVKTIEPAPVQAPAEQPVTEGQAVEQ